jgi:hypothetical protein
VPGIEHIELAVGYPIVEKLGVGRRDDGVAPNASATRMRNSPIARGDMSASRRSD